MPREADMGFWPHEDHKLWRLFKCMEAMEAKAEVFMADAIEAMDVIADGLTDPRAEPPISEAERRAAMLRLCEETFDRLMRERAAYRAEWERRFGSRAP
jgi:hypothetical protein